MVVDWLVKNCSTATDTLSNIEVPMANVRSLLLADKCSSFHGVIN